jgi:acetyl esterase/lipase
MVVSGVHGNVVRLVGSMALTALLCSGAEAKLPKMTFVYKTVANEPPFAGVTEIRADVYRAPDDAVRPVLVFLHGGGLVNGNRSWIRMNLLELCEQEGFILVSLDYRLAPEVKLPEIAQDVRDALAWVREEGPRLFRADPNRMAIAGCSSGAHLALLAGTWEPRPLGVCSFWGYGDVMADWCAKPAKAYANSRISPEKAADMVGKTILTGAGTGSDEPARNSYFAYLRREGLWTTAVVGIDPELEPDRIAPFCPVMNVTKDHPPTLLVHGDNDSTVPVSESIEMAAELDKHGVPHELIIVPGAGHALGGAAAADLQRATERAHAFIIAHLGGTAKRAGGI